MKGQVAIEMVIIFGIILLLFIVIFTVFEQRSTILEEQTIRLKATEQVQRVALAFNTVFLLGHNAQQQFYLPDSFFSQNYTLTISNQSKLVTLQTQDLVFQAPLVSSRFDSQTLSGTITLQNQNGTVVIT